LFIAAMNQAVGSGPEGCAVPGAPAAIFCINSWLVANSFARYCAGSG
jgi:hypothetical protein